MGWGWGGVWWNQENGKEAGLLLKMHTSLKNSEYTTLNSRKVSITTSVCHMTITWSFMIVVVLLIWQFVYQDTTCGNLIKIVQKTKGTKLCSHWHAIAKSPHLVLKLLTE